ncbi:sugar phosphate nucleotidyltransferase [Alicyclobacillus ferrooxydans]|uniref:Mannose-1-phosphate guanylyltransferase n=1 Tax=Alicyclobacillus ferrooxydans TaxID=471514 RepID=A0A0P9CXI3_9BACL|nr:sugar phosphate nucleotidyltransferase [Alicyclobacillus ferrooxydans]KPV44467.1 mannose-1-phosphate guanylyltransferase [Alicyclobacillus ferrooxydans]
MRIILLSGGSGKRLWPMSNDSRSKQFLRVLRGPDGERVSMVQRVWAQLGKVGLQEHAYICASRAQHDMIDAQVGDVPFIEEPMRRDTFPAIALASTYLRSVGASNDEVVAVIPVDHYVEDVYFERIAQLEAVLRDSDADLALLGVTPTEPTSKFGYIRVIAEDTGHNWRRVQSFVEKPPEETAKALITEGALWNCGVFCFRLGFITGLLESRGLPSDYPEFRDRFSELPKRSFDYEVVEQTHSIVACAYEGTWKDLGTWGSLSEEMDSPFIGMGDAVSCDGTHVVNELGVPVVTMGLQNAIVVTTPDGILVADKQESAHLKDVISNYDERPMYEERKWGSHRVLDLQKLDDGTEVLTKSIELRPGGLISYQKHLRRSEVWTIIDGFGELALDSRIISVSAGDVIRIYPEQWHAIRTANGLKFIEVQRGPVLVEEDIIRRYLTWDEILQHCEMGIR